MHWDDVIKAWNKKGDHKKRYLLSTHGSNEVYVQAIKQKRFQQKFYINEPEERYICFTQREAETMKHLLLGKTIQRAAHTMHLSPRTVECYLKNMKKKLKCRTKTELIRKVADSQLINTWLL